MLILPNSVGIIPDGNRRWAKKRGLEPYIGHWYGARKLEEIVEFLFRIGIKEISVYTLSTENLEKRDKKEIKELFNILKFYFRRWLRGGFEEIDLYRVKVNFCGNLILLPKSLVRLMQGIMRKTSKYRERILNILIAYGGTYEILRAVKEMIRRRIKIEKVSEEELRKYLLVKNDVDLIIRTGGYSRLSNFLPLQSRYAEIYVIKKFWPDVTKRDIINAIRWYSQTERKFGR